MTTSAIAIAATLLSLAGVITVGLVVGRGVKSSGDLLPTTRGGEAAILSEAELAAATLSTTISLATVVMAYFELAPYLGLWLLWTVVTTAAGLLVVRGMAPTIRTRLESYDDRIPSLHEFIGTEYGSPSARRVAAIATVAGALGAYAVELIVGSKLFAALVPDAPAWALPIVFAGVALTYTSAGGFRAVVVTDRIQMWAIWLFLFTLGGFYVVSLEADPARLSLIPPGGADLSWRAGLIPFLIGILAINVPTYVADMGMWQRIASLRDPKQLERGLAKSATGVAASWSLLVGLAVLAPAIAKVPEGTDQLGGLLRSLVSSQVHFGATVLFLAIIGLFSAMMSTASTLLVSASHALQEDVLTGSPHHLGAVPLSRSRAVLASSAAGSLIIVLGLSLAGFSVADLVFAVYGSQLALTPAVFLALQSRAVARQVAPSAVTLSILLGFVAGWSCAIVGKVAGSSNAVFLAPVVSLGVAAVILVAPLLRSKGR